jgi:hypothetical protein
MIEGTAVRPKVSKANTPRVKAQMGNAGNSSPEEDCIEAIVVPASIMFGDDGSSEEVCRFKRAAKKSTHGFLVGSSLHLIQPIDERGTRGRGAYAIRG